MPPKKKVKRITGNLTPSQLTAKAAGYMLAASNATRREAKAKPKPNAKPKAKPKAKSKPKSKAKIISFMTLY